MLAPQHWKDYELLDSGAFEKLERFGPYVAIRPEPQAVWDKKLQADEWEKRAHARFDQKGSNSGEWKKLKEMPDRWNVEYRTGDLELRMKLALTSFKHVGVFPEQAVNWEYIFDSVKRLRENSAKFLNLFAYTGIASLAAKAAGADVTHLDSVRQVVTWARENMELSGLKDIRWVVEDALKFVKREVKRGNKYHGIILDPPAFGHGAGGERWKLEDHINEMMKHVLQLLDEKEHFLVLNAYSLGFSSLIIENLLKDVAGNKFETGELYLLSRTDQKLPLGVFGRFRNF